MSQHSSTTVCCMNSVVFHFSTVCGILQFFDAVLRYLATFSCGIAVLGPPRSTPLRVAEARAQVGLLFVMSDTVPPCHPHL